jgi:hypothetical protein
VACQFWCTSMFNTRVVGTANALAAGWVSACEQKTVVLYCYPCTLLGVHLCVVLESHSVTRLAGRALPMH